jgi:hypothetical protein
MGTNISREGVAFIFNISGRNLFFRKSLPIYSKNYTASLLGTSWYGRESFKSLFWQRFYKIVGHCVGFYNQEFRDFPESWEPPSNSRRQVGDMKKFPHWGPTILWPVNLTVIWRFLLGAGELINMFVCKEKRLQSLCWQYSMTACKIQLPGRLGARYMSNHALYVCLCKTVDYLRLVGRRFLTTEAWIWIQACPCGGICGKQRGSMTGFSPNSSFFPRQRRYTSALY